MLKFCNSFFFKFNIYLLVLKKNSGEDLLLPVFHEVRDIAFSVLVEAMEKWKNRRVNDSKDPAEFYRIAVDLGKERWGSHCFIGPEAVWAKSLKSAVGDAAYAFRVDLESQLISALDKD